MITYDANGGKPSCYQEMTQPDGSFIFTTNEPQKTGYIFMGWNTSSQSTKPASSSIISPGKKLYADKNLTFYAVYEPIGYTVSYNANGGTGNTTNSIHTYDVEKKLTTNGFKRTGYDFAGWSVNSSATASQYGDEELVKNLTTVNGSTFNLYARWKPITYSVVYNANGGSGQTSSSNHTYDTSKALRTNTYTRDGYKFLGWSKNSNATTPTYTDGQIVKNLMSTRGTIVLYAVWKADVASETHVHQWETEYTVDLEPSCSNSGIKSIHCKTCNNVKESIIIQPKGHSFIVTDFVAPTCTQKGYSISTCKNCNERIITGTALASGHVILNDKAIESTCTTTGLTHGKHCSVCGEVIVKQEIVAKKAHTYKNYVTKATSRANGSIVNKCSVCGTKKSTTAIPLVKTFTLSATNYTYDGKVKTPTVTVKDSKGKTLRKGTDYNVTYSSGRKNVGKYAVKITLKGNYYGTKTLYFNINPKGTTIAKLTPKSKSLTVQWNKQTNQTTGYQIQYSTASNFSGAKTITMSKNSYYAKSITGLAGNKRYYVRVRTYKTVKFNGKNYDLYSPWSSAKYTTTKR